MISKQDLEVMTSTLVRYIAMLDPGSLSKQNKYNALILNDSPQWMEQILEKVAEATKSDESGFFALIFRPVIIDAECMRYAMNLAERVNSGADIDYTELLASEKKLEIKDNKHNLN